ncbi:hypothetical protein BIT28_15565 [Photobacterium proteolyticum]|uniref:SIR2-like domain-containing protein n=1 Tax=Photobacterium proteolyticum TaxID=1903952 RepID=A0A1Q9G902_9GAMM|nr:hypothetical protein [Photobacterium proteolyticum]OLQ70828.1 hypothetical protein BIT28_15565 [Photobacterium proteolyticum]
MYLYNNREWCKDTDGDNKPVVAIKHKIDSALIDLVNCENLIILTGLGTSLHVLDDQGNRLAPTMWNLWEEAVKRESPEDPVIHEILDIVNYHPEAGKENIETLLSHCKLAVDYLSDEVQKDKVERFVAKAEKTIHSMVDFITPDIMLDVHSDFLRRVARRANRKVRTKIFTTNYDKCFEAAGGKGGYVVIDGFRRFSR